MHDVVGRLCAAEDAPKVGDVEGDGVTEAGAVGGWLPMASAKKDGTPVLLLFKNPIPRDRDDLRRWDGIQFVGRNTLGPDGYDYDWNFAAPVGYGGFPDEWFAGWRHLPPGLPPTSHSQDTPDSTGTRK